jgi:hypothetical protein
MFEFILGFIVIFFIAVILIKLISSRKNRYSRLHDQPTPEYLGIQLKDALPIVQALDKALATSYMENVKNRVLREHPKWADHEFDWTFFELKRYFIMNSLLRSVPMFSARVDDIWHEMIMFTRDYEKFSQSFYYETLHHTPNLDNEPIPGERAFFDWIYLSLFESTPNSRALWGGFLKNPIEHEILEDFRYLSEEELLNKYFRTNQDWLEVKMNLIHKMKNDIIQSDQMKLGKKTLDAPRSATEGQMFQFAIGAAVFCSIYEEDHYQDRMSELLPSEYYKSSHVTGGSSCSGFACSSTDHHSGGDSGGSSCSSCGSGCSS